MHFFIQLLNKPWGAFHLVQILLIVSIFMLHHLFKVHIHIFSVCASMALPKLITTFLFVLAFAKIEISTCYVVKGKVSCHDCSHNDVFSGLCSTILPPNYMLEILNKMILYMLPSLQYFSQGNYSICVTTTLFSVLPPSRSLSLSLWCVWLSYTIVYCFKTAWTLLFQVWRKIFMMK